MILILIEFASVKWFKSCMHIHTYIAEEGKNDQPAILLQYKKLLANSNKVTM